MGTFSLGGGKEGSSTRSRVRLDSNGGGLFHFLTSLTETMNYAMSRPGTTKGSDNSKDCRT
jgi:hypothetical protein